MAPKITPSHYRAISGTWVEPVETNRACAERRAECNEARSRSPSGLDIVPYGKHPRLHPEGVKGAEPLPIPPVLTVFVRAYLAGGRSY